MTGASTSLCRTHGEHAGQEDLHRAGCLLQGRSAVFGGDDHVACRGLATHRSFLGLSLDDAYRCGGAATVEEAGVRTTYREQADIALVSLTSQR